MAHIEDLAPGVHVGGVLPDRTVTAVQVAWHGTAAVTLKYKVEAGKVRLCRRDQLEPAWDPAADRRVTVWEVAQRLIRALDGGGETAAAPLLVGLNGLGEVARDLAYRLYAVCNRKRWSQEAQATNGLVVAWQELQRLAAPASQGRMP